MFKLKLYILLCIVIIVPWQRAIGHLFHSLSLGSNEPLNLIHVDVWGPTPVASPSGFRYYLILVDDHTQFSWLYFLKQKSQVLEYFTHFKNHVENLFVF